jgi:hypothetical protein
VSLILEALRKLDRERQVPERGFLVMAPAAWPSQDRTRRRWAWLVLAAMALGIGALLWTPDAPRRRTGQVTQPLDAPATPAPTPLARSAAPLGAGAASLAPSQAPMAVARVVSTTLVPPPGAAPLAAPTAAAAKTPEFVLQAITERDGRPLALISDRMLREGDEIDGARIVKIGDTFVEIDYRGRRTALHF